MERDRLLAKGELFLATFLSWGLRIWASASVKHLEPILIVIGAIQIKLNGMELQRTQ